VAAPGLGDFRRLFSSCPPWFELASAGRRGRFWWGFVSSCCGPGGLTWCCCGRGRRRGRSASRQGRLRLRTQRVAEDQLLVHIDRGLASDGAKPGRQEAWR